MSDRTLALDLEAAETGGLLAGLTGRPAAGDFTLELAGQGPLADWKGDLRLEAAGLVRAEAQIALALTDTTRVRLQGEFEPTRGVLPAPADALVGERLQLALTAVQTGPGRLAIEDLRATTALVALTGSGRMDLGADRLVAQARLKIGDLAALQGGLNVPLAGALDLSANLDGPLMQPKGARSSHSPTSSRARLGPARSRTTFDLAMLERLHETGARVRVVAEVAPRGCGCPPTSRCRPRTSSGRRS